MKLESLQKIYVKLNTCMTTVFKMSENLDSLKISAVKSFVEQFSYKPDTCCCAPGRVNLIGEHTDYNDGFVFPMVILSLLSLAYQVFISSTYKREQVYIDGCILPARVSL